jgi:hypothetical protein
MAVDSCSYGCLGKPESISVTRRRSMTAGIRPDAATQTRCAHPVCSATLTTHGAPLISSIIRASRHAPASVTSIGAEDNWREFLLCAFCLE